MAVGLARIVTRVVGGAHHDGTALPGMVAGRVWPAAFATLAGQLGSTVVVVGTNGKTTTAGLIAEILRRPDGRPIANPSGANMRQAILTSLLRASDLRGRLQPAVIARRDAVFEVDEAAFGQVLPELQPSVIVATNLFRDQLDRYGETDSIIEHWTGVLARATEGSVLVYCADDPRLGMLAKGSNLPSLSYGLAAPPVDRPARKDVADMIADPVMCPTCERALTYTWRSIGHLGDYACPAGHVSRVAPDVAIDSTEAAWSERPWDRSDSRSMMRLSANGSVAIARPALRGLPSAYNVAAAVTAGIVLGLDLEHMADSMDGYAGSFGRLEWISVEERHVVIMLIKNPVSLGETVRLGPSLNADVVLLGLNDAHADGRDVSWIWDSPIAELVAGKAVVLTGSRSADLQLRLKYDGSESPAKPTSVEVRPSLRDALDLAVGRTPRAGTLVVAATYTAMMGLRKIAQLRGDAPIGPL